MGGVIGSCAGTFAGTLCCGATKGLCGMQSKGSRLPYLIIVFLFTALATILRFWGGPLLIHISYFKYELCSSGECQGYSAVYRLSFVLASFFGMHGTVMLMGKGGRAIDSQYWLLKILFLIGSLVGAFFLPHSFLANYGQVARIVSISYLLMQAIAFIDFSYRCHEKLWNDDKENKWGIVLGSGLVYCGSLAVLIVMCVMFTDDPDAGLKWFFILTTLALTLAATALALGPKSNHGVMPASIVTLYSYYLLYQALSADPAWASIDDGNKGASSASTDTHVWLGLVIACASITYSGWSLSRSDLVDGDEAENSKTPFADKNHDFDGGGGGDGIHSGVLDDTDLEKAPAAAEMTVPSSSSSSSSSDDGAKAGDGYVCSDDDASAFTKFHWIMFAASMYMAMVLSDWGTLTSDVDTNASYKMGGRTTVWVLMVSQWVTLALYLWSLAGPYLMPNRFEDV